MSEEPAFVSIGKVMKPRGIQGEAFLLSLTDFPERFDDLKSVRLARADGTHVFLNVAYVRPFGNKRLAIKFQGVDTPEAVLVYRDAYLQVPKASVHPLPDDVFYVFEVVGLPVETAGGQAIGRVIDVLSYPAHDVYVVDRNGEEVLIPAVREIVTIDRASGKIVVQEIAGLF